MGARRGLPAWTTALSLEQKRPVMVRGKEKNETFDSVVRPATPSIPLAKLIVARRTRSVLTNLADSLEIRQIKIYWNSADSVILKPATELFMDLKYLKNKKYVKN
jgi:hypothetical protein